MSAFVGKADINSKFEDVRFVPGPDMDSSGTDKLVLARLTNLRYLWRNGN